MCVCVCVWLCCQLTFAERYIADKLNDQRQGIFSQNVVSLDSMLSWTKVTHSLILTLYKLFVCLFNFLRYLLPYLTTSIRICPFHFHAWGSSKRPNLDLGFMFILCCSIFCYWLRVCCVWFSFSVLSTSLAGKNVSIMTYFMPGGT